MTAITEKLLAGDSTVGAAVRRGVGISVVREAVTDAVWEDHVSGFDGACQEQLTTFSRHRWPGMAQEAMVFRAGTEIVGGCLVMIQRLPLGAASIAIAKWGPILARVGTADDRRVYAAMVDALVEEYAVRRRMMVSILPRASTGPGNAEHEHLIARGFRPGAALPFPDRYFVNLGLDPDAQRKSFEQKWRYHLNKSQKADLAFVHAGPERLPEFDALYGAMLGRKRFNDHSAYETVPALMAMRNETLRPAHFLVTHQGKTVAGALIFTAGDEAVYLYGATTDEALALRAGYFLHWNIICWLKENTAARWYDLGGTDGFSGLHQFKKGMVGSAGVISPIPPVANYAEYAWPRLVGEAAFAARDLVNNVQRYLEDRRSGSARRDLGTGSAGQGEGGR